MASSSADRAAAIDLVASNLLGRAARLTRLLMRSGAHEISRTEVGVLATLSDGPRRITQLATTEALAQPTVTQLIDKLEGRELVSRSRSEEDGRVVLVEITTAGAEALEVVRRLIRAADTMGSLIEKLLPDPDA
jgi:DNA-binding MarR family transcriptional regulator